MLIGDIHQHCTINVLKVYCPQPPLYNAGRRCATGATCVCRPAVQILTFTQVPTVTCA